MSSPAPLTNGPNQMTGRISNSQQDQRLNNGSALYVSTTDADHNLALLNHLSADFSNLLNKTDISDCYLKVKETYMAVHKCILAARSSVFLNVVSGTVNGSIANENSGGKGPFLTQDTSNQIRSGRDEDDKKTRNGKLLIEIRNTEPEIMKQVVIFMYTGKLDLDESNAYALLDAAGRYDVKDLKVHTGRFLADRINTSNVLMLLKAAYKYDNKLVKQRCIEYFINNAKEIMAIHELWKQFAEEHKEIVAELLHWHVNRDLFYNERSQWDAASSW